MRGREAEKDGSSEPGSVARAEGAKEEAVGWRVEVQGRVEEEEEVVRGMWGEDVEEDGKGEEERGCTRSWEGDKWGSWERWDWWD